jgi:predicted nucleic acid-binding protein
MPRFVIEPQVAIALAERDARLPARHRLLAPTLLRSQVLAQLYAEAKRGIRSREDAASQLDALRRLRIRFLGDRVLQRVAWDIAAELGWPDTFVAEYLALAKLQADALITNNPEVARAARRFVAVATIADLLGGRAAGSDRADDR